MEKIVEIPLFGILITLSTYFVGLRIYEKYRRFYLNPILLSSVFIIGFLVLFNIDYEQYNVGGQYLSFFLGPSVVALGVLFYEKYPLIKKQLFSVLLAVVAGGMLCMVSVIALCFLLSVPEEITRSLALQSITSPIAIEVSEAVGGIPSLTAGVVIVVGILGNVVGVQVLNFCKVKNESAVGTALGTSSHGIGTARALELSTLAGAYSGVAMCLNGVFTAFVAPWILGYLP